MLYVDVGGSVPQETRCFIKVFKNDIGYLVDANV